ncbi:Set3 complex subunit with deacetylase, meiotic-specific repressor of sporulation proteins [Balamuthia mandrillaris]
MKFGGGVSLKDSGNFAASSGSSSGSSGSGFSSRKESSKAGKGLFSRLFSGSVNDRVAELIVKEEEEWRLNWPELAALPEEVLVSVHLCSYEQTKGVLYLSTTNICFGERQSGTNESFIFKKRLPLPTLVFVRKTGKGAITVLSHDTKAVLSQFESKQRDLAYETINKLFAPFLPMAQSLHPAILRKDIHTLNLILTSEIAQEKLEELNEDGEPPLASAIRSNDLRITKMMLQYCKQAKMDINFKDRYGYTALHTACLMNVKDEIIEALLNFENIRVTVVNQDGNTPLHYFCKCFLSPSCQDLAQMMINLGADVNFQNESGETALHKAILNDCVRVLLIDCLIENGADVNIVTERGEAPLHYAVRLGRKDVVSQLLCAGADTELVGNLEMKTPLALAQEAQYHEIASHLSRVHDLLSWLKTIGVPELLTFFIQSEIFLDDLLKMSTKKFDRLLDEIEGNYGYEIGENKVRKSDIKNSWQLLKKMEDEKVSKEEVLEMAETLSGKDKQAIIGSLSKIIEESRNKRMTRTSDAAALEAVRKAMAEQAAQEADSADEEEGDDWIMTHSQLEFTKKLGTGASGKVYRGLYKRKDVAIKVLYERGDREEENDPIQELMEEIKVMSNFGESAQEIVRFYGVCLEPAVCLVMEYCERGSLHQVLRDPHLDLSWQMVLSFAKQTARGLELLHGSTPPIFHRDLKTGNLLVTADWHIKVADFGLSRTNTQDNRSALGKLCGTICYCAPELFYGKGFTVSADIFSLGIVFWELVQRSMSGTYKKPYEEYNFSLDVQILVQAAEHGLRPTLPANLPEAVQHLIQRCWSPTVAQRPSAREIVSELEKLEEQYAADPQAWEKTRVVTSSMTTTMTTGGDASTSSSPPSSSDAARAAASAASSSSS